MIDRCPSLWQTVRKKRFSLARFGGTASRQDRVSAPDAPGWPEATTASAIGRRSPATANHSPLTPRGHAHFMLIMLNF